MTISFHIAKLLTRLGDAILNLASRIDVDGFEVASAERAI